MSNINKSILSNGLTIVTDRMSEIETVSLDIMIKVGSRYESLENNGISHFLEHMAFKGTHRRNAKQIAEEFDAIGGYFNAYTARECTVYNCKMLKGDVNCGLDILADILQNSLFEESEMAKELQVIEQEIAQNNDTPDDLVFDYFQEAAYNNQPIGRSILGTEQSIASLTPKSLKDFIAKYYRAPNMYIAAAGNLEHATIVKQVENLFSGLSSSPTEPCPEAIYNGGTVNVHKDLEQVQFLLGYKGSSYNDSDYYIMQLLTNILGGGMSSRLFQEVREKRGLCYSIGAFNNSFADSGLFAIYAATNLKQTAELLQVVMQEMDKLSNHIDDDELARARTQLKAGLLMSRESSSYRAADIARNYAFYGRHVTVAELMQKIDNITIADVKKLNQSLLLSTPTLTTLGPVKELLI